MQVDPGRRYSTEYGAHILSTWLRPKIRPRQESTGRWIDCASELCGDACASRPPLEKNRTQ